MSENAYTGEEVYAALLLAQDALYIAAATGEDLLQIRLHKERVDALYTLLQMQPLRPKEKIDTSGLAPKDPVVPVSGEEGDPADCTDETCMYAEPHKHGFACDKSCSVCGGK